MMEFIIYLYIKNRAAVGNNKASKYEFIGRLTEGEGGDQDGIPGLTSEMSCRRRTAGGSRVTFLTWYCLSSYIPPFRGYNHNGIIVVMNPYQSQRLNSDL